MEGALLLHVGLLGLLLGGFHLRLDSTALILREKDGELLDVEALHMALQVAGLQGGVAARTGDLHFL